jgi:DNA-binding transcriptional MerR regulator
MEELQNKKIKSANALRTIGEVSESLNLPPHVLRFWESKFSQIKPVKRRGGHRYYRPEDIDSLREIKSLLYDRGYTIKGAQKLLKDAKSTDPSAPQAQTAAPTKLEADPLARAENKKRLKRILHELVEIRDMLDDQPNIV